MNEVRKLDIETRIFDTQKKDNNKVVRIFTIEKFDETKAKINSFNI